MWDALALLREHELKWMAADLQTQPFAVLVDHRPITSALTLVDESLQNKQATMERFGVDLYMRHILVAPGRYPTRFVFLGCSLGCVSKQGMAATQIQRNWYRREFLGLSFVSSCLLDLDHEIAVISTLVGQPTFWPKCLIVDQDVDRTPISCTYLCGRVRDNQSPSRIIDSSHQLFWSYRHYFVVSQKKGEPPSATSRNSD